MLLQSVILFLVVINYLYRLSSNDKFIVSKARSREAEVMSSQPTLLPLAHGEKGLKRG